MSNQLRLTSFLIFIFVSSCNTYTTILEPNTEVNGTSCPTPIYVATLSKNAKGKTVSSVPMSGGETKNTTVTVIDQESLTMYNLLADARAQYGKDITIQNIRWDMKNKKRISVIYDVVKCK